MRQGRGAATATAAVVGVVGLVTLLVGWAATVGPPTMLRGGTAAQTREPPTPASSSPSTGGRPTLGDGARPQDHPWVSLLFVLLETALALLALYLTFLLVRAAVTSLRGRRRSHEAPDVDFDVLDAPAVPARLARAIAHDAPGQRAALVAVGTPRNAIVACWQRFEEQAATAGVVRQSWETSSEFTLRILDQVDAEPAAVSRLAGLYREARFSEHELGEDARAQAVAALDAVHHGLLERAAARAVLPEDPW